MTARHANAWPAKNAHSHEIFSFPPAAPDSSPTLMCDCHV